MHAPKIQSPTPIWSYLEATCYLIFFGIFGAFFFAVRIFSSLNMINPNVGTIIQLILCRYCVPTCRLCSRISYVIAKFALEGMRFEISKLGILPWVGLKPRDSRTRGGVDI